MSGVTDVDNQQYPAPKHSRWPWWLAVAGLLLLAVAGGFALRSYSDVQATPAPPVVVTRTVVQTRIVEQTVIVSQPPRTVEIRIDQTVPVTRIVEVTRVVNTYNSPTPPTEGRG